MNLYISAIYEAISTYKVAYIQATCNHTIRNKMAALGMFTHGKTNFAFPPTLCELDCNRRSDLRDSETFASPRIYMTGVHRCPVSSASGAQKFGGKKNMKREKWHNNSL